MTQREPPPWEVTGEEVKGDFEIFRARAMHVRSPDDGAPHTFHVADAPDGAVVLALTPAGRLVMVRQWRHPVQRLTLELPSGIVDPGEAPAAAAARELREETGYAGEAPECLGTLTLNPSWQTTRLHVMLVRGARPAGPREPDGTEETRVCTLEPGEAVRLAREGGIDSAPAVAALGLLHWSRENGGGA